MGDIGWNTGRGESQTKNTYLGQTDAGAPALNLMDQMSTLAKQNQAQRNLLFGGAGYNRSFETPDQTAYTAATKKAAPQKPIGGWYGYGNSGMGYSGSQVANAPQKTSTTQPGSPDPSLPPSGPKQPTSSASPSGSILDDPDKEASPSKFTASYAKQPGSESV